MRILLLLLAGCGAAAAVPAGGHAEFHCFTGGTTRSFCARSDDACGAARKASAGGELSACAVRRGAFCFADQGRRERCAVTEDDCEAQRKATDIMLLACVER